MTDPFSLTSASALKKIGESAAKDIFRATAKAITGKFGRFKIDFEVGFQDYIQRNYLRCYLVKTLLYRMEPVPIDKSYVNLDLLIGKRVISEEVFVEEIEGYRRVIIVGPAGSGKSMMMKHIFVSICRNPISFIPLYIELRHLNNEPGKDLFDYIYEQWSSHVPEFSREQMDYALKSGKFLLLLDGLDEIDHDFRRGYHKQLSDMAYRYKRSIFVVSSRPDDHFEGWHEFYTASILAMEPRKSFDLISRLDFDAEIKKRFLKEMETRLAKSHKEFLSNPLLCTMMLITYIEFSEIPEKIHIFYAKAFDALFGRHDRAKTSFQRKFYTHLLEDDFKRLFSTFSLISYLDSRTSFDEGTVLKYISRAAEFDATSVDPKAYLNDLREAVSILIKDGEFYNFLHRSFQEYFVALFVSERHISRMPELIDTIMQRSSQDDTISLLIQINRDAFELKYFNSKVKELNKALNAIDVDRLPNQVVTLIFESFTFQKEQLRSYQFSPWHPILTTIERHYARSLELYRDPEFVTALSDLVRSSYKGSWVDTDGRGKLVELSAKKVPNRLLKESSILIELKRFKSVIAGLNDELGKRANEKRKFVTSIFDNLRERRDSITESRD